MRLGSVRAWMQAARLTRSLALLALSLVAVVGCAPGGGRPDAGPPPDAGSDAGPPARRDAGPPDTGFDATPCGLDALCGADCADLATDPAHCGACDVACDAPTDGAPVCAASVCGFVCDPGFAEFDGACLPAPRPLWPPSLATAASQQPTLRWELPSGLDEATVELCADRACDTVLETLTITGTEAQPVSALPPGGVFWRVVAAGRVGPTWEVRVGARSVDGEAASGLYPDYDGDGLGDVVVGAPRVAESEGRAYAFFGSPTGTPTSFSVALRSPDGPGAEYALALTCAGDLDGDGFADLAVGAPRAGAAGRVHVYLGGPAGLGESPSLSLDAPAGGSLFGATVAGLGDVDGDGYGELLVGAIGEGVVPGRAYLYRGGPRGPGAVPAVSLIGGGRFASALAGVGDVNGDGFADALIGAYGAATTPGEAHLFLGGSGGLETAPSHTYVGTDGDGAQFGFAVAGLGDVDGDGLPDLAVGAPAASASAGSVHVFLSRAGDVPAHGPPALTGGTSGGAFFGHAVAGLGDGNGDGFADLAVGAFGVNDRRGRVTILVGSATGLVRTSPTSLEGIGTEHDYGWSLAAAGDVDGNGRADLAVGAPGAEDRAGRVYVHRGGAGGVVAATPAILVAPSGGAFGRALADTHR